MKRRRKTEKTEQYKRQNGYCTCIGIAHGQHRCTKAAHMIFVMIQVTWSLVPAIKYKEKKRNICRIKMNGFTTFLSLSYQRTKRSWCLKHDKRRFYSAGVRIHCSSSQIISIESMKNCPLPSVDHVPLLLTCSKLVLVHIHTQFTNRTNNLKSAFVTI